MVDTIAEDDPMIEDLAFAIVSELEDCGSYSFPVRTSITRKLIAQALAAAPTPSDAVEVNGEGLTEYFAAAGQANPAPSVASCLREAWVPRCEHDRIVAERGAEIENIRSENHLLKDAAAGMDALYEAAEARAEALAGALLNLRESHYKHPQPSDMRRIDALLNPPTERPHGT